MKDENAIIEILAHIASLFNEEGVKPTNLAEVLRETGLLRGKLRA